MFPLDRRFPLPSLHVLLTAHLVIERPCLNSNNKNNNKEKKKS